MQCKETQFYLKSENIMSQKVTKMLHDQNDMQNFTFTIIDYQKERPQIISFAAFQRIVTSIILQ